MSDFDQMGIVVDWVDACRKGDLTTLLDLYADDAELECICSGSRRHRGSSEIEAYWRPRLGAFSSAGFRLEEIHPASDGVDLEYSVAGTLRIRASFRFSPEGKIRSMLCEPARQNEQIGRAC